MTRRGIYHPRVPATDSMRRTVILAGLLTTLLVSAVAGGYWYVTVGTYGNHVTNEAPLRLSGDEVLVIEDTFYEQRNDVQLADNATLVVRDSRFSHRGVGPGSVTLEASDNATLIVDNSVIETSPWVSWWFSGSAAASYRDSQVTSGLPWQSYADRSRADVVNAGFGGTIYDNASIEIRDSPDVMVELYVSGGQVVNITEIGPGYVDAYTLPNEGEAAVGYSVAIEDSTIQKWGVGVRPHGTLRLRDSRGVNICLPIDGPYRNETIRFDGLARDVVFEEKRIEYLGTQIELINTSASGWCVPVGNNNSVHIADAGIDDIQYSRTTAPLIYENVTAGVVIADHGILLEIIDSTITGSVVARGNATVILEDTEVAGEIQEQGGTIIVR